MRVIPLASSSKGNAYVVQQDGVSVLIDCGVNLKTLKGLLAEKDLEPTFEAVLVTHSHSDHTKGLGPLLHKFPDLPVYANAMTAETVACQEKLSDSAFVCFENGQDFEIGPFAVSAFSIPHDTSDPVGYLIRGDETYFHGTDIGTPLDSVGVHLAEADFATLESNHDPVMLRTSGRPPSLIQRIAGPRGHLSNDQACELVSKFASTRLKRLFLAHLSQDCNAPHLALAAMRATLDRMGRPDVEVEVLS